MKKHFFVFEKRKMGIRLLCTADGAYTYQQETGLNESFPRNARMKKRA